MFDAIWKLVADTPVVTIGVVGSWIAAAYGVLSFHTGLRRQKREAAREGPSVKATINSYPSVDGWRSVQFHIQAPLAFEGERWDVQLFGWRIKSVKRMWPLNVKLALVRPGDGSLKGPIQGLSPRTVSGRTGSIQPFALEFFLRFRSTPTADRNKRARFRVKISRKNPLDKDFNIDVWAAVPHDALSERPAED